MKPRHLAILFGTALAIAAVVWLFHTPPPPPEKTADAPKPAAMPKVAAPMSTTIAPPVAQPVQSKVAVAAPAPTPPEASGDPQKELNTSLDDIANLLQAGNLYDAMMRYIPPDTLDKMFAQAPPDMRANMQAQLQQQMSSPEAQQGVQMMIQVVQSMKGMTPEMDSAGEKATYQISDPTGENTKTEPFVFKKIDGKWYVDPESMGGM